MHKYNHDWMVRSKMKTLLIVIKRNFSDEGDVAFALLVADEIEQILTSPTVTITDACRIVAREDLALMKLLIISK
jgi:hypothetical protein